MQELKKAIKGQTREGVVYLSALALIFNLSFLGVLLVPVTSAQVAEETLCAAPVDMVLILDRSGSMVRGDCEYYFNGFKTAIDVTEQECEVLYPDSVFTPYVPTKLESAQSAANSFLNLMGTSDQSALVSFATDATLDKQLSNDHSATEAAVNSLSAIGATNIGDAIAAANGELGSERANAEAVKAMILLTDGQANKPNGEGFEEDPIDVAYAEAQAATAASLGYKIFTIGLGSDVNATMLGNIASVTGGAYYSAPSQEDLETIYNNISQKICEYGSIAGCKWLDENADGIWQGEGDDSPETTLLSDWEIVLDDGENTLSQPTNESGCYQFSGLMPGVYTLTEVISPDMQAEGWSQTYPNAESEYRHEVEISGTENIISMDFGNYQSTGPVCGDGNIDEDLNEICDDSDNNGLVCDAPYGGSCSYCSDECQTININGPYCGDGIKNGEEACDGTDGAGEDQACTQECTLIDLGLCGNNEPDGDELCDSGQDNGLVCEAPYGSSCTYCSLACEEIVVNGPYCGDTIQNGEEQCDGTDGVESGYTCTNECTLEKESNGGGGPSQVCGDNIREGSEECDGTDVESGYQCRDNCTKFVLGNTLFPTNRTGGGIGTISSPAPEVLGEEGAPVLSLSKTVDAEFANPGDKDIRYRITVTNNGNLTAFNVVISDNIPDVFSFTDADGQTKTWEASDLKPGETREVTYLINVSKDADADIYTNLAEVSADNHETMTTSVELEVRAVDVLAETGMNYTELMILFGALTSMIGGAQVMRRKTI